MKSKHTIYLWDVFADTTVALLMTIPLWVIFEPTYWNLRIGFVWGFLGWILTVSALRKIRELREENNPKKVIR